MPRSSFSRASAPCAPDADSRALVVRDARLPSAELGQGPWGPEPRRPSDFYSKERFGQDGGPCGLCRSCGHSDSEHFARALLVSRLWAGPGLAPVDVLGTSVWQSLSRHGSRLTPDPCTVQVSPTQAAQPPWAAPSCESPRGRGVKRRVSAERRCASATLLTFAKRAPTENAQHTCELE